MPPKPILYALALLFFLLQPARSDVLITPFQLDQVDSTTTKTINDLFIESYQSFTKENIKKPESAHPCRDKACALEAAKQAGAAEVVHGIGHKLGEKWIVSAWRLKSADGSVLASERIDSKSIEDFEFVMKRLAESLATGKKSEETATIDNVTESEMGDDQYRRREGFYAFGVKFGYLFPTPISKSYGREQTAQPSQIATTDWINWFELPRDLALEWDLHVGWEWELGTHFDLIKLLSRSDFAPFVGGGLGIDYVFRDVSVFSTQDRASGFALNGKAGMMLFRTYSFRALVSAGYKIVLNSDNDQGVTADLGIIWKKHKSAERSNPVVTGLAIVGGTLIGLIILGIAAGSTQY